MSASIKERINIPVYNYNEAKVYVVSNVKEYSFEPFNGVTPSMEYMSYPEIAYLNSRTEYFKAGYLRFSTEDEAEIYESLGITDWQNILTNQQIEEILLKPTVSGLQKILSITKVAVYERIKPIFMRLCNSSEEDMSMRVTKLMKKRFEEVRRGQLVTEIEVVPKAFENTNTNDSQSEIQVLREQNELLQKQIADMKALTEQLIAKKVEETTVNKTPNDNTASKNIPSSRNSASVKKRGRPKKG